MQKRGGQPFSNQKLTKYRRQVSRIEIGCQEVALASVAVQNEQSIRVGVQTGSLITREYVIEVPQGCQCPAIANEVRHAAFEAVPLEEVPHVRGAVATRIGRHRDESDPLAIGTEAIDGLPDTCGC